MHMSPQEAYAFVRQKRPQVCLADGQWNAVREVRPHPGFTCFMVQGVAFYSLKEVFKNNFESPNFFCGVL